MKIIYDREVDALYIRFTDTTVTTKHLEDGIALDSDLGFSRVADCGAQYNSPEAG